MQQQRRNLSIRMRGEDVRHLQSHLRQLGIALTDSVGYFGRTTQQAVQAFQKDHHLEPTGEVDETTAAAINQAVEALRAEPKSLNSAPLNKEDLLRLNNLADISFRELKDSSPALFAYFRSQATSQLQRSVESCFQSSSEEIRKKVAEIAASDLLDRDEDVFQVLVDSIQSAGLSPEQTKEALGRLLELDRSSLPTNPISNDTPVKDSPIVQGELLRAKMYVVGNLADLTETKIKAVLNRSPSIVGINDAVLESAIEAGELQETEAIRLGLAANIYQLVDENTLLAERLKNGRLARFGELRVNELRDLSVLEAEDWLSILQEVNAVPPGDITQEEYSCLLAKRLGNLFPSDAFIARLKPIESEKIEQGLTRLRPLFDRNASVFRNHSLNQLNVEGVSEEELDSMREDYNRLRRLANLYPGLGLLDLLDDDSITTLERASQVTQRIALLSRMREQNPTVEFLALDYSPDSADVPALDFSGFSDAEQQMLLTNLKAYQRTHVITGDVDNARTLLENGYHSAVSILRGGQRSFTLSSGLEPSTAQSCYKAAQDIIVAATAGAGTILDITTGFQKLAVSNLGSDIDNYLKKLSGYADLFGDQTYCMCEHCQSILSPAAYFVDLMDFVWRNASKPTFEDTGKADHPLNLKIRRPDLWALELTCENTDTLVPTVDIINEILEAYIASDLARRWGRPINLNDRAAVEKIVYETLSKANDSFRQPFVLPLEKLQVYLEHFAESKIPIMADYFAQEKPPTYLEHISSKQLEGVRLLGNDSGAIARAMLKISRQEYDLINRPNTDLPFLEKLYHGVPFQLENANKLQPFNVQLLLKPMGLSRAELGELLETRFIETAADPPAYIKAEKRDANSAQNDVERIYNIRIKTLDRMHRFIRLWRRVSWKMSELDLVLSHLADDRTRQRDSLAKIDDLATVLRIQADLGLSVESVCALFSDIPTEELGGKKSLFNRLFNMPTFLQLGELSLLAPPVFVHPSFPQPAQRTPADTALAYRLRAGLNVTDEELYQLIVNLAKPLGLALTAKRLSNRVYQFRLSLNNLTLLYRHALLAKRLKLSMADLFRLVAYAGIQEGYAVNLKHVTTLLDFHSWLKVANYSLDDLGFITGKRVEHPDHYPDMKKIVEQLLNQVQALKALEFADTVFAFLPGVTEEQSRKLVKANVNDGSMEAVDIEKATYRLSSTFNLTTDPSIPADAGITIVGANTIDETREKLRAVLLAYHSSELIPLRLAAHLSFSVEKTKTLLRMIGANLNEPQYALVLQGDVSQVEQLEKLVEKVLPLSILFKGGVYDADSLDFVCDHGDIFSIQDFTEIDVGVIRLLSVYAAVADTTEESKYSSRDPGFTSGDVRTSLLALQQGQSFSEEENRALARILRGEVGFASTMLANIPLPNTAPEALQQLIRGAKLAKYLGVDGESLKWITAEDYESLGLGSDAVLGAFRANCSDEKEWKERSDPFEDRIRSIKRDALTDYLLHSQYPQFETLNDLYHYFLIDVELTGCARTSRIVAAISSVQLHVHRILMNLEQDRLMDPNPDRVHIKSDCIPAEEWAWRKNYRVWEANRKVFLYPENYIEPELRTTKTPLFKELESTLLQQEINDQNVLDAYASYMTGFEEVAQLKIAGAYHDINDDLDKLEDTLHIFGVTPSDPPTYYYRAVDYAYWGEKAPSKRATVWNPWRKIDVQIPVRKVSPFVYNGRMYVFWVEIKTSSKNQVEKGDSKFSGYKHKISLKYTMLRLDETWTAPQSISLSPEESVIDDPLPDGMGTPKYDTVPHLEPKEDYTLTGFMWEQVYPKIGNKESLDFVMIGSCRESLVDFYAKALVSSQSVIVPAPAKGPSWDLVLHVGKVIDDLFINYLHIPASPEHWDYACRSILLEQDRLNKVSTFAVGWEALTEVRNSAFSETSIVHLRGGEEFAIVNGSVEDCIIDAHGDLFLLQPSVATIAHPCVIRRLGTTISETIARVLFENGLDGLLDIRFQEERLKEAVLPFDLYNLNALLVQDKSNSGRADFDGPFGLYFWEIFFHIPFLIANHLNSQGNFSAAQHWYHYIFDPTAIEKADSPEDRNWRYLKFRSLGVTKLRDILMNPKTIEIYEKDPFDPHAIAALRPSAYQKCIVMKYIDNLLDWGDDLFSKFTMESVNEATLLYIMAADILGDRPVELGKCGEASALGRTYERIAPLVNNQESPFLIEMENVRAAKFRSQIKGVVARKFMIATRDLEVLKTIVAAGTSKARPGVQAGAYASGIFRGYDWMRTLTGTWISKPDAYPEVSYDTISLQNAAKLAVTRSAVLEMTYYASPLLKDFRLIPGFGWSIFAQVSPVFCVPHNKELKEYWDRVENRLYKIRHCMDIKGVRRQLALFAPEIDPRLLVRAKALGLSIEDVLNSTSGELPPYRFTYLIEKAKQCAGTVQSIGSALLSAMEKKDVEELNRLKTVHEQNIQRLTTQIKQWEIDAESETISALERQAELIQYRKDHYQALIDNSLSPNERVQQVTQHLATALHCVPHALDVLSSILYLIPQAGSPFAMKFGGKEEGDSTKAASKALKNAIDAYEAISRSAGLEASFQRREEDWKHQVKLADYELKEIERKLAGAEIKKKIVQRSLELHQRSIQQTEEIYDFYKDKFSNFGLYTWLSTQLQRLYRDAYNGAYSMARLAEQAFRFERGDESSVLLGGNYWDSPNAGLLAGERLLIDLQDMERRFIETNYRSLEIDQSFSLAQIDPEALIELRENGSCLFKISEIYFDLFYPGHYNRKIKAVRITIPCITGPYVNVSATLALTDSQLRNKPNLNAELKHIPLQRSTVIASSKAQNDSGVFEFNFRDERYMPFEGAGAISSWSLSLPRFFRQFDYQTISDVILHVSYTAETDILLQDQVEQVKAQIQGNLLDYVTDTGDREKSLKQLFSLRYQFPNAFHKMLHSPLGTTAEIDITDNHFPIFLKFLPAYRVHIKAAWLILKLKLEQNANDFTFSLNGTEHSNFTRESRFGGLPLVEIQDPDTAFGTEIRNKKHILSVASAGDLAPLPAPAGDKSAIDENKLLDVMLYIEYGIGKNP